MSNPDRLRDPHIRAATLVGSIDESVYAVSTANRQALVAAVTEDLAAAANEAIATNVLVGELEVRVDTLETTTETLTSHASATDARVGELETRAEAVTQVRAEAAEQQSALLVDIAERRAAIDARLDVAADHQAALLADFARRRATIDERLEAIERLAAMMGLIADTPSVPDEIQPPSSRKPH